jgi:hypothetical protein
MAEDESQAAHNHKTAEAKRLGVKRMSMIHLDIERIKMQNQKKP